MKTRFLKTRVTESEYRVIVADADKSGLTISEHIRTQLFDQRQAVSTEVALSQILTKLSVDDSEKALTTNVEMTAVETLLLVREIALNSDPQALNRVNNKLDRIYGAGRSKQ